MKVVLKSLTLTNFKGARSLTITPNADVTTYSADNGKFKTTIADAYSWLLYGKDSYDRKDFDVKTLDSNNNPIHKLDHEVTGVFDIDGLETTLKRTYKEKWVKPKGAPEAELSGHETLFWYNGVPCNQTEYKAKLDAIAGEETMKLLTNPMYFNNSLSWEKRRKILMDIVGVIDKGDILNSITDEQNKTEISQLSQVLNAGKTADEYKKELSAKRKLLNDELSSIPTRIDEADRSMPNVENWQELTETLTKYNNEIIICESEIENRNNSVKELVKKAQEEQTIKYDLETKLRNLSNKNRVEAEKEVTEINNSISVCNNAIRNLKSDIEQNESLISKQNNIINQANDANAELRTKWEAENSTQLAIDPNSLNCPACKQPLPESDVNAKMEQFTVNFHNAKQANLARIKSQGEDNNKTIECAKNRISELKSTNESISLKIKSEEERLVELETKKSQLSVSEYKESHEEIDLKAQIDAIVLPEITPVNIDDLKSQKLDLQIKIDDCKKLLNNKEQIDKINVRIKELKEREKELAQMISDVEKIEFVVSKFTNANIEELDKRLKALFPQVSFKLFNTLINGNTEPCCEILLDGIPFSSANSASKINAGLAIINVLCDHYGLSLPIIVDNKESINNPIKCKSQTIFLSVGKESVLTEVK